MDKLSRGKNKMNIDEFNRIYKELSVESKVVEEGKMLNSLLAGTALTAGTLLGLNKLSNIDKPETGAIIQQQNNDDTQKQENPDDISQNFPDEGKVNQKDDNSWVISKTLPFILTWEGQVLDEDGNHILYDDNVKVKNKRRWDGQGRTKRN